MSRGLALHSATARLLIEAIRRPESLAKAPLRQWDVLLRLARRANLMGRLAESLAAGGLLAALPAQVHTHLQSARVLNAHQRQAVRWEVGHLANALGPLQIQPVLLKGTAYAITDLAAARGRHFGDVDVLVPRAALDEVEAALMMHGWGSGVSDPYDDRYYRQWMHELPPMSHRVRGTVVDVHHNILPTTARHVPPVELLLESARPAANPAFRILSPVDMVIHSATHLFHEGELQNGLRDLFDLDALLVEFAASEPDFWACLPKRAATLGLVWPLDLALRYSSALLGTSVPPAVIAETAALSSLSRPRNWLLDGMYRRALAPDHPLCNDRATAAARFGLYLRGHALRMPPHRLALHLGRKAVLRLFRNSSRLE